MAPVQVVGAVAGDDEQVLVAQPRDEEAQHVPAGGVRPVQVLEHEQERVPRAADRAEHLDQPVEQLEPVRLVVRGAARAGRAGQQPRERGSVGDDRADRLGVERVQLGQRLGERQVRQPDLTEVDAVRHDDPRTGRVRQLRDVPQQPGLADARVGADAAPSRARRRPRAAAPA